jgi:hypothetical protein
MSASRLLCLPPAFMLVSCLAHSSTLKIEATCSSETPVDFERTTWRYIPQDRTLALRFSHIHSFINTIHADAQVYIVATRADACAVSHVLCKRGLRQIFSVFTCARTILYMKSKIFWVVLPECIKGVTVLFIHLSCKLSST